MKGFYKYPLHNDDDYQGRMVFQVVNEQAERVNSIDFTGAAGAAFDALLDTVGTLGTVAAVAGGEVRDFTTDTINNTLGTNVDSKRKASQAYEQALRGPLVFNRKNGDYVGASKQLSILTDRKVTLYLPQAIQIQDAVQYDNNVELGAIGGAMMNAQNGPNLNLANAITAGNNAANNAIRALSQGNISAITKEQASLASQSLLKNAGARGQSAANALSAVTGTTANPNTRTLFRSVPIRNFSFNFTLIPTSRQEAEQIKSIIKFFREELYPEALTVGGIDYGYRFPNRMLIRLTYRNKDIPGVKFLPVYLQSFNAVYNANGMGMHSDGNWAEAQITLNFTETKPLAKQDIERGF